MRKTFLEQNPFYILEVSPNEKRASIISKAEEKAFFADSNECEEAQAKLLNPEKRLSAELNWFYEISIEKMADIHNCISESKEIAFDDLTEISRLNAVLHNFSLSNYDDYFELGYAILEIDELYNNVNITDFLTTINTSRQQSGLREVLEDELEREFNKKRDQIRQLISDKTINLNDEDYIDFITMIAEKCIADEDYNDGIVISDIVDQYEIKTQDLVEEAADEIYSHIERIKEISNDEAIEDNINGLIRRVKKWDRLVQPLQLKSMASGVAHGGSQDVGREVHEFSVWLHNEKGLSDVSLRLIDAMKPIFAELGELAAVFESDSNALTTIIRGNKEAEQAVAEMDSLKASADSLKVFATSTKVDEFIEKVRAINKKVKLISLDAELLEQVRENICYIARDVAITLHNDKQQTEYALKIAKVLVTEFGDLYELKSKLTQDVATLSQQSMLQSRIRYQQQAQEDADKAKRIGCLVVVGIFLLIFLISGLSQCDSSSSSSSSKPSSGYSDNYGYQNNAETYTVTLDKQGGTGGTSSITATDGEELPYATAPTRSGYEFNGYYSKQNGLGTKYYDSNMNSVANWYGSSNETIYAYWIKESNDNNYSGISVTRDNFEDYFTLTTDAEFVGDNVEITYSIKPKSNAYAKSSKSSDTIKVEIGAVVSDFSFYYGEPSWDEKYTVTLSKSKNYTASGSFSFSYYSFAETVYWLAEATYCSGSIGE